MQLNYPDYTGYFHTKALTALIIHQSSLSLLLHLPPASTELLPGVLKLPLSFYYLTIPHSSCIFLQCSPSHVEPSFQMGAKSSELAESNTCEAFSWQMIFSVKQAVQQEITFWKLVGKGALVFKFSVVSDWGLNNCVWLWSSTSPLLLFSRNLLGLQAGLCTHK